MTSSTEKKIQDAVSEIMDRITDGTSRESIEKELKRYDYRYLIPIDKAKNAIINDHSSSRPHKSATSPRMTGQDYAAKYGHKVSSALRTVKTKTPINIKENVQIKGFISDIESRTVNVKGTEKTITTAVLYDDEGSINVTFWWDYKELSDGDDIHITFATCSSYNNEQNLYVNKGNARIIED